jgi:RNA polymerase sigma factor (sigma-70 family)
MSREMEPHMSASSCSLSIYIQLDLGGPTWDCPFCPYRIHHNHPTGWKDAVTAHKQAHPEKPKRSYTPERKAEVERQLAKHRHIATAIARSWGPIPGLGEEDVEQEGLIALLEAHENYDPGRGVPFPRFAETVIRLRMHDLETKAKRQKHAPLNTSVVAVKGRDGQDVFVLQLLADRTPNPHRVAVGRETLRELALAIEDGLTDAERAAIRGVLNGRPYSELAAGFEAGERGVDNAVQRARRKLRLIAEGMG